MAIVASVPLVGPAAQAEPEVERPGEGFSPIDFRTWTAQGGSSRWTTSPDGREARQSVNGTDTFLVSAAADLIEYEIQGTILVDTASDDDYAGLGFGLVSPIAANGDAPTRIESTIWAWKQKDQREFGTVMPEGFTLSRLNGTFPRNEAKFWEDGPGVEMLAADLGAGKGWKDRTAYSVRAQYRAGGVTVWVDDRMVSQSSGLFDPGHAALFNFSQPDVVYRDFEWRSLVPLAAFGADAGPDISVEEGQTVTLTSEATGADGPFTYQWDLVSAEGPPVQLSSSATAAPSFVAYDDGRYRFRVTISDGTDSATDEVEVIVNNQAPDVRQLDAAATATDGLGQITVVVGDPGVFDSHEVRIDWGDGTPMETVPITVAGSGWGYAHAGHRFPQSGVATVEVVAVDDDAGESAPSTVVVELGTAGSDEPVDGAAVWAGSTTASNTVRVSGSNNTVEGLVHSNHEIRLSGSQHAFTGGTEYVTSISTSGSGHTIAPAAVQVPVSTAPYDYIAADYQPGGRAAVAAGDHYNVIPPSACKGGKWKPTTPLASGLFVVPCGVQISGSDVAGQISIVATGDIKVSGSSASFTPFVDGLLFMSASTGNRAIDLSGSSHTFGGAMYSASGGMEVSGSNNQFECGIVAQTVRISGSSNRVAGANCSSSGGGGSTISIAAAPVLVPRIVASLTADAETAVPGDTVRYTASLHNGTTPTDAAPTGGAARWFLPALVGVSNTGSGTATVTQTNATVEYHSVDTGEWEVLGATAPTTPATQRIATLTGEPIAAADVTYPGAGFVGTSVDPGGMAAWTTLTTLDLTVEQVRMLVDPAKVDGIRTTVSVTTEGSTTRTIHRYPADPLEALREDPASDVLHGTMTVVTGSGGNHFFDDTTTTELSRLAPGAAVDAVVEELVPPPAPRVEDESEASYLSRLRALDDTILYGAMHGSAEAGVGRLLAAQRIAATDVGVPIVEARLEAPGQTASGTEAVWTLHLTNTGSVTATDLNVGLMNADGPLTIDGVPESLSPGATASVTGRLATLDGETKVLAVSSTVSWTHPEGPPDAYGPLTAQASTEVRPALALVATKIDRFGEDTGPNDIDYLIEVRNEGSTALTNVVVTDPIDPNVTILESTVETSQGTWSTTPDALIVELGTLPAAGFAHVSFRVRAESSAGTLGQVTNQAHITSNELPEVMSDDPSVVGAADPTVTPVRPGGSPVDPDNPGSPGNGAGPLLEGCDPEPASTITEPTPITCTLVANPDTTITSWSVDLVPIGGSAGEAIPLGSGTGTAVAATIDPTLLDNGIWNIRITATGSDHTTSAPTSSVIIDGRFKPGRYAVSYQDLSVPVAGIPIQVTRSYDTLDRLHSGDFGYGWELELSNIRVQANRAIGRGSWDRYDCGTAVFVVTRCYRSTAPHYVSVTWPDGRVETFDAAPQKSPPAFDFLTQMAYTPRPGATSRLEPAPSDQFAMFIDNGNGDSNLYVPLTATIYNPTRFVVVTPEGTRYLLDTTSGLVEARTLNDEVLTVTANGIESSSGPGVAFTRDAEGRITTVTGPSAETRHYGYDPEGDLVSFTDGRNNTVAYNYDDGHRLTQIPGPGPVPMRTLTFDPDGRVSAITDGENRTTPISFDLNARTQTVMSPIGDRTTVSQFNELGDLTQEHVSADGRTITSHYGHDPQGRVTYTRDPDGHETHTTYDTRGNVTSHTDANNTVTTTTYNSLSQPIDTVIGGEHVLHRTYDTRGRMLTSGRPGQEPTRYTYEAGRLVSTTDPNAATSTIGYNAHGYPASITGPGGTVGQSVDDSGRVRSITTPMGSVTSFDWDDDGNLTGVNDPWGRTQAWTYNWLSDVLTERDKLGRATTYAYDSSGALERVVDRVGSTTTHSYGGNGQLTAVTAGGVTTTMSSDGFGRPIELANPTGTIELSWSDGGALRSETTTVSGVGGSPVDLTFTTDGEDQISTVEGLGSTTTYERDPLGRMTAVDDSTAGRFVYRYDSATGRLTALDRPNGVTDDFGFDPAGRLIRRNAAMQDGTVVTRAEYGYDDSGLRSTLTDLTGTHSFAYDEDGRLTAATHPSGSGITDESYSYDKIGNRTAWTGHAANLVGYDNADRLLRDATYVYTYDNEGRLLTRTARSGGAKTTYTWNALGQLTQITDPSGTTTYGYDPLGRRAVVNENGTTHRFVWQGHNLRGILDDAGSIRSRIVTGDDFDDTVAITDESGNTAYVIADGIGSATAVTDASGGTVSTAAYDTFGNTAATGAATVGFTGLQADSSGLNYARARYYDPRTGRFLSEDPVTSTNRYTYANNSPVMFVDPLGEMAMEYSFQVASAAEVVVKDDGFTEQLGAFVESCAATAASGASVWTGRIGIVTMGEFFEDVITYMLNSPTKDPYKESKAIVRATVENLTRPGTWAMAGAACAMTGAMSG